MQLIHPAYSVIVSHSNVLLCHYLASLESQFFPKEDSVYDVTLCENFQ